MPFIIFSLPRSRSAWLSRFLTYGEWTCGHDEIRHARSMDDVRTWFTQPNIGTAETAGAPWWRLVEKIAPGVKVLVVRRPVEEVVDSYRRMEMGVDLDALRVGLSRLDKKLSQIEYRMPEVLSVAFDSLREEETCARVFEHCLPYRHDHEWWKLLSPLNVQIDMRQLLKYYSAHKPQLDKLTKVAKQQSIAGMVRTGGELEGVTLQQESFDTFSRDGKALFAEHSVQVGESPDAFWGKNIELMRMLDQLGAMQITTARSNGRMFGYLITIIAPSLESAEITTAVNTTFFASADFRGLGMKLQHSSLAALRARGVDEVYFRAGVRGAGPKMGAMYRRLGASPDGQLYKLDLVEAT